MHQETEHPFSPAFVVIGGGLTLAAGIAAVPLELHAQTLYNHAAAEHPIPSSDAQSFYTARTWAYVTVGGAIGMATLTSSLAAWYFLGTSSREIVVTPAGIAGRF
jgi:hypothetical protein